MNQLEKDYRHCHNIMKLHSKTFSYAFDMLELNKKKAVWAIYAVCRIIDDSIDEYQDLEQLECIANDLDAIYNHNVQRYQSDDSIMNAYRHTLKDYAIPHQPLQTLIHYVKEDLHLKRIQTDEDLSLYCYGVAGTVGELLTPILASKQKAHIKQAEHAGIALGKALQLTNILRDVGEDFKRDRIYLSRERLALYNVDLFAIYQGGITQSYINLWESYAQEAIALYEKALNGMTYFDEEVRYIIEVAASIYLEILEEVRQSRYTLHQKVFVNKRKKLKIYREVMAKYNRGESI
ncbi:phytoene/squalene synthase family protein [Mammaliicoccus sciuri]|uniref:phytoene/squalene synthase family protein n=1 Tax=Mammaliicoccus sciuri TaxID=1296 RepID=UPI002DBAC609|nr:phytoene/squalene synthase family protein [Mammaliicoccus sciuri]MEB8264073.1 phytoene/squalene synthase family protein [Mammaliicoccus sciuri]